MKLVKEINWTSGKRLGIGLFLSGSILMLSVLAIGWEYFMGMSWYLFLVLPVIIVLHEALHGLLFWRWTGGVKFGYLTSTAGPSFYAAAPGKRLSRNKFIVIGLVPQILTAVCLLLFLVDWPDVVRAGLLFTAALNFGGGSGDFYVVWMLLKQPSSAQVEDDIGKVRIYA